MRSKSILCFGEVLWDAFGETKVAGGAPMNVAWHLKQQGADVQFASSLGNDPSGDELAGFLEKHGLYSELIQRTDEPTCEVTVSLDAQGHATYVIPVPVSWDDIDLTNELIDTARNASALVFGSLACRSEKTRGTLFELLDETTALTVFDVNLREPHYHLDTIHTLAARAKVIKMNEEEANLLLGAGNRDIKEKIILFQKTYHTQTICITRGDKGAALWHNDHLFEHPGFEADVADTVGAGDAFLATLIIGLLNDEPPEVILEKACKIGAYVATQRGATPVYTLGEL